MLDTLYNATSMNLKINVSKAVVFDGKCEMKLGSYIYGKW